MSNPTQTVLAIYTALPEAVGDARSFTASTLTTWKLSHLTEIGTLLVSELMTNSIKHADGIINPPKDLHKLLGKAPPVMLALSLRDSLRAEVWDQSSTLPIRRQASDDDTTGRGLDLVEMLAKEWGSELLQTGGKITWFSLDLAALDIVK